MVAARRAAARMIDTLTSRDRFCAIAFDNAVDLLPEPGLRRRDRSQPLSRRRASRAGRGARRHRAAPSRCARGRALLAGGHDDRERVIVLVTDGQVGNEDHILRELRTEPAQRADVHARHRSGGQRGLPPAARGVRRRAVRARRVRGSARRRDGQGPPPDRHADRDRAGDLGHRARRRWRRDVAVAVARCLRRCAGDDLRALPRLARPGGDRRARRQPRRAMQLTVRATRPDAGAVASPRAGRARDPRSRGSLRGGASPRSSASSWRSRSGSACCRGSRRSSPSTAARPSTPAVSCASSSSRSTRPRAGTPRVAVAPRRPRRA